jgi:hypothetical protein
LITPFLAVKYPGSKAGRKLNAYVIEEQLNAVINEKGEAYQFERDTKGNIIKEIGFDENGKNV